MSLIVYLTGTEACNSKLLSIIRNAAGDVPLDIFYNIKELTDRLSKPFPDAAMAVLYAASRADLMELIFMEPMLSELRLVLVLPDRDSETIAKAHRLRPRFIALAQDDFDPLESVLKKMMALYGKTGTGKRHEEKKEQ